MRGFGQAGLGGREHICAGATFDLATHLYTLDPKLRSIPVLLEARYNEEVQTRRKLRTSHGSCRSEAREKGLAVTTQKRPVIAIDGRLGLRWPRNGIGEYVYRLIVELGFLSRPYDIKVFGDSSADPEVARRIRFLFPVELVLTPSPALWDLTAFPQAVKGSALLHGAGGIVPWASRIPRILTVHSAITRRALKRASVVLTLSEALKEAMANAAGIAGERVVLTPPAPAIAPASHTDDAVRETYLLAEAGDHAESLRWALQLFGEHARHDSGLRLRIIVTDPQRESVARRLVQAYRPISAHIDFVVPQSPDDLALLYKRAAIVLADGQGVESVITRLNGYAAATPVIAQSRQTNDALPGEENLAFWLDTANAAEGAQRVHAILENPVVAQERLDRARTLARSYTWKKTAELTHQAYLSILQNLQGL